MAIDIIQGFDISKNEDIDAVRAVANSEAEMLAIKWVYEGLKCVRTDTSPYEIWICQVAAATQPGTPEYTLIGEWEEFEGTAGSDGTDGTIWFNGAGIPSGGLGEIGDYYVDNVAPNTYYKKTGASTWTSQGTLQGATGATGPVGDQYADSSATSVDIDAAPATVVLTVSAGLAYTGGQTVIIASQADPLVDFFTASVTAYSSTSLSLGSISYNGTGAHTDWDVNINGAPGQAGTDGVAGNALIHIENNLGFTAAKITSVESGGYTAISPWSASILTDDRTPTEMEATAGIIGDMSSNSITYNGTAWSNNGRWLGLTGAQGAQGDSVTGPTGPAGADGAGVVDIYAVWTPGVASGGLDVWPVIDSLDIIEAAGAPFRKHITLQHTGPFHPNFGIEFPTSYSDLNGLEEVTITVDLSAGITAQAQKVSSDPNGYFYLSNNLASPKNYLVLNEFCATQSLTGARVVTPTVALSGSFTFVPHKLGPVSNTVNWQVVGGSAKPDTAIPALIGQVSSGATLTAVASDGASWTAEQATIFGTPVNGSYIIKRDGIVMDTTNSVMSVIAFTNGVNYHRDTLLNYISFRDEGTSNGRNTGFDLLVYLI